MPGGEVEGKIFTWGKWRVPSLQDAVLFPHS